MTVLHEAGRPLGDVELLYQAIASAGVCHHSTAVMLDRRIDPDGLRDVIDTLARAHPLLGATVLRDTSGTPWFQPWHEKIAIVWHGEGTCWQDLALRWQATPFAVLDGPLFHVDAIADPSATALLLTIDHRVADGASLTPIVADLGALVTGRPIAMNALPCAMEDELDPPEVVRATFAVGTDQAYARAPAPAVDPQLSTFSFSEAQTRRLSTAARKQGASITSCLVAAALRTTAARRPDGLGINLPVDLRRNVDLRDLVSVRITWVQAHLSAKLGGFWHDARMARAELVPPSLGTLRRAGQAARADRRAAAERGADAAAGVAAKVDLYISNLGVMDGVVGAGTPIDTVYAPVMASPLAGTDLVVALTSSGRLHLSHARADPDFGTMPANLLDLMGAEILTAIEGIEVS